KYQEAKQKFSDLLKTLTANLDGEVTDFYKFFSLEQDFLYLARNSFPVTPDEEFVLCTFSRNGYDFRDTHQKPTFNIPANDEHRQAIETEFRNLIEDCLATIKDGYESYQIDCESYGIFANVQDFLNQIVY
ncbi:MAG: hypothetical protein ACRCXZ_07805, partial [Patescibacteria group bacterium]